MHTKPLLALKHKYCRCDSDRVAETSLPGQNVLLSVESANRQTQKTTVVPLCILFMILLLATSSHEGESERAEPQLKDQQILVAIQVTVLMQIHFLVHFDHRFSSDCLKSI